MARTWTQVSKAKIFGLWTDQNSEPLFKLYSEIGKTAAYMDTNSAPLFEYVGGQINTWYLAAAMAYYEPELLAQVEDIDTQGNINIR